MSLYNDKGPCYYHDVNVYLCKKSSISSQMLPDSTETDISGSELRVQCNLFCYKAKLIIGLTQILTGHILY